jgi:hypothetical protein
MLVTVLYWVDAQYSIKYKRRHISMYRHDGADPGGDDAEWKHEGEHSDRHLRKASHSFLFIDKQFNTRRKKRNRP